MRNCADLTVSRSILPAHINTSYRHFLLFVNEFGLIDKKELAPLHELNEGIVSWPGPEGRARVPRGADKSLPGLLQLVN